MNFKKLAPSAANWFLTTLFSFSQREVAIIVRVNISKASICSHTSASGRPGTVFLGGFFSPTQYNLAQRFMGGCFMVTATHVSGNVWCIGPLNIALRSSLLTPLPPPQSAVFQMADSLSHFLHPLCHMSRRLQRLAKDPSFAGTSFRLMSLTAAS